MKYIYKITNLTNGKVYIGQHKWRGEGLDPKYFCSSCNKHFWNAVRLYGMNNFKKELIQKCWSDDALDIMEEMWIKIYKATDPCYGYNISVGGNGHWSQAHNKDSYNKRYKTQLLNGSYKKFKDAALTKEAREKAEASKKSNTEYRRKNAEFLKSLATNEEVIAKRLRTNIESGELDRFIKLGNTPENRMKAKEKYYFEDPEGKLHLMDRSNAKQHHPDWIQIVSISNASEELKDRYDKQ